MKLGYTKKVNLTVGLPFLMFPLIIALVVLVPSVLTQIWLLSALVLVAQVSFLVGCCLYAIGKGHHPALGLLGLLSIPGLVILAFFPDKHKGEDTGGGCFSTLLYLLPGLALIFGPLIFYFSRSAKNHPERGVLSQQQDKLKASMMKLNVTLLTSSYSDLGSRIKAMDSLLKEGSAGIEKLKEVKEILEGKSNISKDDEIVLRRIEEAFAAGAPLSENAQIAVSTPAVAGQIENVTSTTPVVSPASQPATKQPALKKKKSKNPHSRKKTPR